MKRWFLIVAVLALALSPAALAQGNLARLRFVQVAPGAPPLDMVVNDSTVFSNLDFRAATPYALVTAGVSNLRLTPPGASEGPLVNVAANLSACTDYTLLAVGAPGQVEPLLLLDDNSPPSPGQARVRFVNASPDAPAVDVSLQQGLELFSDVSFKGVVGYASLNGGSYTFEVRQAGTGNLLLTVPSVALESCSVYTIFLTGLVNGQPPLEAFATADAVTACAPPPTAVLPLVATPTRTSTPVPIIVPRPVATLTPSPTAVAPSPSPLSTATAVVAASPTPSAAPAQPPATATAAVVVVTATPQAAATAATGKATAAAVTATPKPPATVAVTATATSTPRATVTLTATVTATGTLTPTRTATPLTPTATATAKATAQGVQGITAVAPQALSPDGQQASGLSLPQEEPRLPRPWWQLLPQIVH